MAITIGRLRIGSLASNLGGTWSITPATPTVTINSNTSLTIDWVITGLDKTVTAVELWHSTDGTTYTRLVKLGAVATYDHDGLANNSIHYYKVRYWAGLYVSGLSGVISETTYNYSTELNLYDASLTTPLTTPTKNKLSLVFNAITTGLGVDALSDVFDVFMWTANDTKEASNRNIVKLTHDAIPDAKLKWIKNYGYYGDGATKLNLNWKPNTDKINMSLNSVSLGAYRLGIYDVGNMVMMGELDGSDKFWVQPFTNGKFSVKLNDRATGTTMTKAGVGLTVGVRTSDTSIYGYDNGTVKGPLAINSVAIPNKDVYVFCYNNNDTPTAYSYDFIACLFIGKALSSTQLDIIKAAIKLFDFGIEDMIPTAIGTKSLSNPIMDNTFGWFASFWYNGAGDYVAYGGDQTNWDKILRSTSSDGISWTLDAVNNPMLTAITGRLDVSKIWKEGTDWYMLYRSNEWGNGGIGLATSSDGVSWTKYASNPVLTITEAWEDVGDKLLDPWGLIKVGTIYYLYYNQVYYTPRKTGIATSTDLINWTKYTGNPVLTDHFCVDPFKIGDYYYLMTTNSATVVDTVISLPWTRRFALYRSLSPFFTNKEFMGYLLLSGEVSSFDDAYLDTPCILTNNINRDSFPNEELLEVYYCGYSKAVDKWRHGKFTVAINDLLALTPTDELFLPYKTL